MTIHEPPSSYMLREISEVTVPEHVSWFPQTIGWKILAIMLSAFIVYKAGQWIRQWWENRYRREAITLVTSMQSTFIAQNHASQEINQQINFDLFEVMKAVLTYINPKRANTFGDAFLIALDSYLPQNKMPFNHQLGRDWMRSLVQKQHALSSQELTELLTMCEAWLQNHSHGQGQ